MGGFLLEAKAPQSHRHSRWFLVPRATALGTAAKATKKTAPVITGAVFSYINRIIVMIINKSTHLK